ncbi:MAG: hypothetical protein AAFY48_03610 [Bacteroidota bacterium]
MNPAQPKETESKRRTNAIWIGLIVLVITLLGLAWAKLDEAKQSNQRVAELEDERDAISQDLSSTRSALETSRNRYASLSGDFEAKQAELERLKTQFEDEKNALTQDNNRLKMERDRINTLLAKEFPDNEGLAAILDSLNASIDLKTVQVQQLSASLDSITLTLQANEQINSAFNDVATITDLLLDDRYVTTLQIQQEDILSTEPSVRDSLQDIVTGFVNDMNAAQSRLTVAQERIARYMSDTTRTVDSAYLVFQERIRDLDQKLTTRQESIKEQTSLFATRYLLVASTRDLMEKGILTHRGEPVKNINRPPKRDKLTLDFSKITLEECLPVDIGNRRISFGANENDVINVLPGPGDSYEVIAANDDPNRAILQIFDKQMFWSGSAIVIIETK